RVLSMSSTLFPYTTLFRSLFRIVGSEGDISIGWDNLVVRRTPFPKAPGMSIHSFPEAMQEAYKKEYAKQYPQRPAMEGPKEMVLDRKSTRLNSSHVKISYA